MSVPAGLSSRPGARRPFFTLHAGLQGGRFRKRYRALVAGAPAVGASYESPLESSPRHRARVRIAAAGAGRPARTEVLTVEPIGAGWSLVEVEAAKAVRHQIRVHLASAGHPLAGDALYGGTTLAGLSHHFLHASGLAFEFEGQWIEVAAPLPFERLALLERLAFTA